MRKRDAFDSLLAEAGQDPFKFGPKSMNQIREHAKQSTSPNSQPTPNNTLQTTYFQQVAQQKPAVVKKRRDPSIDITGLEDLDQSTQNVDNGSARADVFDVFSDVGAFDVEKPKQVSAFQDVASLQVHEQQRSQPVSIQQDLVRISESQELPSSIHLSKSTPNIAHETLVNELEENTKDNRNIVSTPPTPPCEPMEEYENEHQLSDVVLGVQSRRQSGFQDNDGLKNMWNGIAKSAKNISKNLSKKVNELVSSQTQSQFTPVSTSSTPPPPQPVEEYQEFLAIAVAKMPTEDKRKKFISRLDSADREAVLTVFREQRQLEQQLRYTPQQSDQPAELRTQQNSVKYENRNPDIPVQQSRQRYVNLVDTDNDAPTQSYEATNLVDVRDSQIPILNVNTPKKGGNDPSELFAFDDSSAVKNESQGDLFTFDDFPSQSPQSLNVLVENDPLAELYGGGNVGQGGVGMFGDDLMNLEDDDLVQLVNARCEELAQPGEPLQRKEFRRIRLMQEAKKVREKMQWKKDMEEKEERAKEDKQRAKGEIMEEITKWKKESTGIQGYLCNLHKVLWEGADWKPVPLSELLEPNKVKKTYLKAQLVVHPDKVNQKFDGQPPPEIEARADMIAAILKESMAKFSP